jgi:hypothetical protein
VGKEGGRSRKEERGKKNSEVMARKTRGLCPPFLVSSRPKAFVVIVLVFFIIIK